MASLALFFPGADAAASGHTDASRSQSTPPTSRRKSCGTVNVKGVTGTAPTPGNPFKSSHAVCLNGHLIAVRQPLPSPTPTRRSRSSRAGQLLFAQTCSSCHGNEANGVGPEGQATIGPNLVGLGAGDRRLLGDTGRMPAADVKAVEAERRRARLTPLQALELAAWVNSLDPAVPAVPYAAPEGRQPVGRGRTSSRSTARPATPSPATVTRWPTAPTPRRCAERHGPPGGRGDPHRPGQHAPLHGQPDRPAGATTSSAYVTDRIQHPTNPGGFGLGGVGPVAEGFVALLIGVGGLVLVCFWIGERS